MPDATDGVPVDPFDLDALRSESLQHLDVEKTLTTVPVRRPKRGEFFRVHPSDDYVIDSYIIEREDGMDRVVYWVAPSMRDELFGDMRKVRLYTCITKRGTVFLWPVKLPLSDSPNSGRAWQQSALEAAEAAKTLWVKMTGNRELGAYEIFMARGDLGEPQWPDKTFRELIGIAFKGDRIIDSLDHPVIRELNGEL
ncbi:hypothetical protein OG905_11395 [Streptomyces sp. NBC_00322]|uniref:hypothetical protein n=1 Tax=Streptomyces sp. NBC_00322 TaxID=2975712 RepID=UPI002E2DB311|nr:hypothetical protein [Streptomyces sp. NBC_00322]